MWPDSAFLREGKRILEEQRERERVREELVEKAKKAEEERKRKEEEKVKEEQEREGKRQEYIKRMEEQYKEQADPNTKREANEASYPVSLHTRHAMSEINMHSV